MNNETIKTLLNELTDGWACHDVVRVVNCFAEDGVYSASLGPEPGTTCVGKDEIRSLVKEMFRVDAGSTSTTSDLLIMDQTAAWRWRYEFPDGSAAIGCDFFEFKNGKIVLKDAYRKSVPPTGS